MSEISTTVETYEGTHQKFYFATEEAKEFFIEGYNKNDPHKNDYLHSEVGIDGWKYTEGCICDLCTAARAGIDIAMNDILVTSDDNQKDKIDFVEIVSELTACINLATSADALHSQGLVKASMTLAGMINYKAKNISDVAHELIKRNGIETFD